MVFEAMSSPTIWTVGHGARPLGAFLDTLSDTGIGTLADVRRYQAVYDVGVEPPLL